MQRTALSTGRVGGQATGFGRSSLPGSRSPLPTPRLSSVVFRASNRGGDPSSSRGGDVRLQDEMQLRSLEAAVPQDQRPANELRQLKDGQLYSWATLPLTDYVIRLALIFGFFFTFVGGPISYQTFDPFSQSAEWFLSASVGSLTIVAIAVIRIYLGWSYVGERLMSAAVAYEESGWYDGETFVKPPEILTRDRLLGMYEVKPVMGKLRTTLIGSGALLALSAILLTGLIKAGTDADGMYGRGSASARPPQGRITADGLIFSSKVKDLSQLREDDELAAAEAESLGGVPGYCRDRMYRAVAGGQFCAKFDVK